MIRVNKLLLLITLLTVSTLTIAQSVWKPLKTGAGGWITGMDINPSGSPIFARSDVNGAYRWNASSQDWTFIAGSNNLPSSEIYWDNSWGVLSIVSAPSNNTIAYMAIHDGIFRSTDQGDSWTKTNLPSMEMYPNDDYSKLSGERLSVDPQDEDVVFFGSIDDGLWYSNDGGNNWSKVTAVPDGEADRGVRQILFDQTSGTTAGKTNRIYAFVDGEGVYKSEDTGINWTLTSFGVSSPWFYDAEIASDGKVYICGENSSYQSYGIYQYDGNNWSQVFTNTAVAMGEIAVDPFDANRVFIWSNGFTDTYRCNNVNTNTPTWDYLNFSKTATGIPWLSWTYSDWFSIGEVVMDPVIQNKIWMADGVGTWITTDVLDTEMTWEEKSVGQEHLVSNDLVALPNDRVVTAHWDRPVFHHNDLDVYPSIHQPSARFNSSWDLDVSPIDPNYVVAIIEDHRYCCYDADTRSSGYSEDGGLTWTKFATMPNPGFENSIYGQIAVSATDKDNIVWLPVGNQMPYVTNDRGNTWTQITLPNASSSCCLAANYFKRRALTADRVLANTFYIYDFGNGSIFKTSDGGFSWVRYADVTPAYAYNVKLTSVPNQAGHLLFAKGAEQGINLIGPLQRSTDGGQTWSTFSSTNEVLNVTLGKEADGASYPSIFIYGRVNGVLGYWMSTDEGVSWTQIGDYPMGLYDWPAVMEGDMNVHGRLYIGFNGNGFVYHDLDAPLPVTFLDPLWGYEKNGENLLRWSTSEEINVGYFQIEQSLNGKNWSDLKRIPSQGNAQIQQQYRYTDKQPEDGVNYYRIKIVDLDGSYTYSNIINITNKLFSGFQISPNPAQQECRILSDIPSGTITIVDLNGKTIIQTDLSKNKVIDLSELKQGVYIVKLTGKNNQYFTEKLVKIGTSSF